MKRLTAKNDEDGVVLLGSPSVIELAERLHQFEQLFDDESEMCLRRIRDNCDLMAHLYGDEWQQNLNIIDRILDTISEY